MMLSPTKLKRGQRPSREQRTTAPAQSPRANKQIESQTAPTAAPNRNPRPLNPNNAPWSMARRLFQKP